mmetsp:Transcript_24563/g.56655  ORF Transcript_24563/g.56655 Transcript_24563/m.56655 type:complete len:635 (+) Transcript_24563:96-2000(+)
MREVKEVLSDLMVSGVETLGACVSSTIWNSDCAPPDCQRQGTYIVHSGKCGYNNGSHMWERCHGTAGCPLPPPAAVETHGDSAHHVVQHMALVMQLPFFACVISALGIGEALHRVPVFRNLPESFVVVVVAAMLGLVLRLVGHADAWEIDNFRPVSATTMNLVLLPIIIFTSGWAVPFKHMFNNFGYIVVFAVLGTLLSTCAITAMIMMTSSFHCINSLRAALCTAILMSATDPVATLATFAKKKVEPTLNVLVFGESIINDAVAVVLFGVINHGMEDGHKLDTESEQEQYFEATWHQHWMQTVAHLLVGSMICGWLVACGLVLAYRALDHWTHSHVSHSFKYIFVLSAGYFVNGIAESLEYSGIIACLFAGITMSIYLRPLMGEKEYKRAGEHLQILAEFGDLTVFIMVGVTTAFLKSAHGVTFGIFLFFFCLIGRAISVAPCALICNFCKMLLRQPKLCSFNMSTMMWHAGLRGGIALCLVMQIGDWVENPEELQHSDKPSRKTVLVTATFLVISLLLVIMGGTTDMMLDKLEIETGVKEEEVRYDELHAAAHDITSTDTIIWKAWKLSHRQVHKVLVGDKVLQRYIQGSEPFDIEEENEEDTNEQPAGKDMEPSSEEVAAAAVVDADTSSA